MTRKRWAFVAAAAAVVVLVVPAVGEGKAERPSFGWSLSRGGAILTSYDFGAVAGGARVSRWFRLGSSRLTKSGALAIRLTGSPSFAIVSDRCNGKSIGKHLSCWVSVAYAPSNAGATDSATLRATGEDGADQRLSLSACSSGGPNRVYWVTSQGTVKGVPHCGGSSTTLVTGGYGETWSVAVDSTHVYWASRSGTVNEVPLGGGPVTTLASGQDGPFSVAVDGTHVYWVNVDGGTVNKVSLAGGSVTTLASGQDDPFSVAVDRTHVYWVNEGGTVKKVPLGGGSVTTLATGQIYPLGWRWTAPTSTGSTNRATRKPTTAR